ncbi:hypothetical protein IAG44_39735 [Streptomyces roseirectus]|uniref:DUF4034 domain-containing protein n=1 Tax=Streptomyces roseirectus TaxID=2768066 RepID=A0A7H0IQ83_9ACTN|nr:hypothetical protein [Streptomyces roseirectus]QNP74949.1 hypothetical protein IAG44_39735 [Streptomyces roseirectus]
MRRLVYHPAGHDDALRVALVELGAGHWRAMRDLLRATGERWGLRTSRTQVLAVAAARSDVTAVWVGEESGCYDAWLMSARVAVERALRARRTGHRQALTLEVRARTAVWEAISRGPGDPVAWVCLLALAQLDTRQVREEHRSPSGELGLPGGPWGLLREVDRRDPCNREAYHRVVQFLLARECATGGESLAAVHDFGRLVASRQPWGSPVLLLPAYGYVERRRLGLADGAWRFYWADSPMTGYTLDAFHHWFRRVPPVQRSVADLSMLAYALWAGERRAEAAEVLRALEPYAAHEPWATVHTGSSQADPGEAMLLRARAECLPSGAGFCP